MSKPTLYSIERDEISQFPKESIELFVSSVLEKNLKPSEALKRFIDENNCKKLHAFIIFDLLKAAYPNIIMEDITFKISDSNYPFGDPADLDDEGFDSLIVKALQP